MVSKFIKALQGVVQSSTLNEQTANIKTAAKKAKKLKGKDLSNAQFEHIEVLENILVKTKAVQ